MKSFKWDFQDIIKEIVSYAKPITISNKIAMWQTTTRTKFYFLLKKINISPSKIEHNMPDLEISEKTLYY